MSTKEFAILPLLPSLRPFVVIAGPSLGLCHFIINTALASPSWIGFECKPNPVEIETKVACSKLSSVGLVFLAEQSFLPRLAILISIFVQAPLDVSTGDVPAQPSHFLYFLERKLSPISSNSCNGPSYYPLHSHRQLSLALFVLSSSIKRSRLVHRFFCMSVHRPFRV